MLLVLVTLVAVGCSDRPLLGKPWHLMGDYEVFHSYVCTDSDGVECRMVINSIQSLDPWGLDLHANVSMTYCFEWAWDTRDITLDYDVKIKGNWWVNADTINLIPDVNSINIQYIIPDSASCVDQVMARQMRKLYEPSIESQIRQRLSSKNKRDGLMGAMIIRCANDRSLICAKDSSIILLTKEP